MWQLGNFKIYQTLDNDDSVFLYFLFYITWSKSHCSGNSLIYTSGIFLPPTACYLRFISRLLQLFTFICCCCCFTIIIISLFFLIQ